MKKKKSKAKKCQLKFAVKELHEGLGRILYAEKTDRLKDARDQLDQNRKLPGSSQIPYLP